MDTLDDEILQSFVDESREHLADIENDLLLIEEAGANIDEELVNKVFRAAHSIKGGAGFMGLDIIKELAHKIENVLGMIRSKEIVPDSEIINILLLSFDQLRELLNNVTESNEANISEHIVSLNGITSAYLPNQNKSEVSQVVDICHPNGQVLFTVAEFDISHARKETESIYLVEYDLIHDVQNKGVSPFDLITKLDEISVIIDCKVDVMSVGTLETQELTNKIPFILLIASELSQEQLSEQLGIKSAQICIMSNNLHVKETETRGAEIIAPPSSAKQEKQKTPEPSEPVSKVPPEPVSETPAEPVSEVPAEPVSEAPAEPVLEVPAEPVSVAPQEPVSEIPAETVSETMAEVLSAEPAEKQPELEKAQPAKTETKPGKPAKTPQAMVSSEPLSNLRVNVSLLDKLMNLAGELVLSRNQLIQAIISTEQNSLDAASQRINMVTSELQETIMLTRMQSIGNVFSKFPRVVRDLARDLGKQIELTISGKEVELDKTLIEGLSDPLTHLVRNSVDHGIEDTQTRIKRGKPEIGHIQLKAYHQAGQVNIEITDDGKGIDPDKIAESAINKGLISPERVKGMSDKDKIDLIFQPGFSMAEKVTDVSGRGVGMDVVKTNLDKLGGQVEIDSEINVGTTIKIKLPLTLAIIPSLMVSTSDERYAIPLVNVAELLRIPADKVQEKIERVGDAEVVRLREELLPLMYLNDVLDLTDEIEEDESTKDEKQDSVKTKQHNGPVNIVVVSAGAFKYGLVVDQLHDSEEIVVKPLGRHMKRCQGYAGATIMGNGKVALIIDIADLARVGELTSIEERSLKEVEEAAETVLGQTETLLLFGNTREEKFAVPVDTVGRIEKVKTEDIENVGGKKVIKYRGGILPVYAINEVTPSAKPLDKEEQLLVIVFEVDNGQFGLLATTPVDTVETTMALDTTTLKQDGILGSTIIDNHTVMIIDVLEMIKILNPNWLEGIPSKTVAAVVGKTILYAEDSTFFRNQVKGFLEDEGYRVIEAEDGQAAWNLLQERYESDNVTLVLTDVEMPNLDGVGFATKIKQDKRFSHLPVVALTTLADDAQVAKGKAAGIDDYQVKLDKKTLLSCVHNYMDV